MRSLSDLIDRLLHSRRRRKAINRLDSAIPPGQVLFVCYGNICRSPFAAAAFRRELAGPRTGPLADSFSARSAGFTGADRPSPSDAIASARQFGIDLSGHRSTLITPEAVRNAVLIVAMSADQGRDIRKRFRAAPPVLLLGDLDPQSFDARTIRDPFRCPPDVFDDTYARIDRCIRELARVATGAES